MGRTAAPSQTTVITQLREVIQERDRLLMELDRLVAPEVERLRRTVDEQAGELAMRRAEVEGIAADNETLEDAIGEYETRATLHRPERDAPGEGPGERDVESALLRA